MDYFLKVKTVIKIPNDKGGRSFHHFTTAYYPLKVSEDHSCEYNISDHFYDWGVKERPWRWDGDYYCWSQISHNHWWWWWSLITDDHWSEIVMCTDHWWWSLLITDDDQFYLSVMISGNWLCCRYSLVIINANFFLCSCFFINHHSHECSFSDDQQCGRTWSKSVWTKSLFTLSVSRYLPQSIAQDKLSETWTPYYTLVLLLEAPA